MPKILTVQHIQGGKPGKVYYPLKLKEVPKPTPRPGELLIRMSAAALNHRDLFIRQHLYPGISFENPMLADGCGTVVEAGPDCSPRARQLLHRRVVLTPSRGWDSNPEGPDPKAFSTIGGSVVTEAGTALEFVAVPEAEVEPAPDHLSAVEAAALPLVGLTAWRAFVTKCGAANAAAGRNILITGIGGGVALAALQFAVARGCGVWVTSSDGAKIDRAVALGARGGVSYRDADWDKQLQAKLPRDRPFLDAVIDGAGGDIVRRTVKLLKPGGIISSYGMTLSPKMDWLMQAVMKNIELRGSTMGSRAEFAEMMEFVRQEKIRPVVSRVVKGLDNLEGIDSLFQEMKQGKQFGKLVIQITSDGGDASSKL